MTGHASPDDRVLELITERAIFGLSEEQQRELQGLMAGVGAPSEAEAFELAAAAAQLAMTATMPMPATLRRRLEAAADEFIAARADAALPGPAVAGMIRPGGMGAARTPGSGWMAWLAAAACLVLAVAAWWPSVAPRASLAAQREALVTSAPDLLRLSWGDFNSLDDKKEPPELKGITGEVVWSDARQAGFLTFKNLPMNDPSREQYQLWIVDAQRGLGQRVDGGVFDVSTPGECTIAINGKLRVTKAIGFAVTIEKPEGVVVSDMSRRVVLALKS
ncbi:MAG: anti-sigma factor [Phycisphaerales bacterium]|nr:anti-sigma factor [Phycisphaerales bacterium]